VAHQPRRGEQNGGRAVDCEGAGLLMRLYFEAPTDKAKFIAQLTSQFPTNSYV
jgi:hypothetical protein